ncbi:MAG: hypothetical protein IPK71_08795 [Myxococcales bacterium]|nr:hypothetical protein [Myxococcales bacterium]
MGPFVHLASCLDLARADIAVALESRDACFALGARLSYVSRTGETADALLRLFAFLASGSAEWVDGEVRMEVSSREPGSAMVTFFERRIDGCDVELFPPLRFLVSPEDLRHAAAARPEWNGRVEAHDVGPGMLEVGFASPRSTGVSKSGVRVATRPDAVEPARQTLRVGPSDEALRKLRED